MPAKMISYNTKAREHLLKGVNTLADAVKVTLAPEAITLFWKNLGGLPRLQKMA